MVFTGDLLISESARRDDRDNVVVVRDTNEVRKLHNAIQVSHVRHYKISDNGRTNLSTMSANAWLPTRGIPYVTVLNETPETCKGKKTLSRRARAPPRE